MEGEFARSSRKKRSIREVREFLRQAAVFVTGDILLHPSV